MSKCDIHDGQHKNKYGHIYKKEKSAIAMSLGERERERERGTERESQRSIKDEEGESKFAKCNLVDRIKGNLDARMVMCLMHPFKPT